MAETGSRRACAEEPNDVTNLWISRDRVPGIRERSEWGFSATEMLVAVAFLGLIAMAIPSITGTVQRQKSSAVSRKLVGDIRWVQSQAISTGWDYRLVGFPASATNGRSNQYRMLGRRGATAWPSDTGPSGTTATTYAGPWIDVATVGQGIEFNPADATGTAFFITFDARGSVTSRQNFGPFQLSTHGESTYAKSVTVSAVGRISIQ